MCGLLTSFLIVVAQGIPCLDSSDWEVKVRDEMKNCDWVAENPYPLRCKIKGTDKKRANASCRLACNTCSCSNSKTWRFQKKNTRLKKCNWIGEKPGRCNKVGQDNTTAKNSCKLACGKCIKDPTPTSSPTDKPTAGPTSFPTDTPNDKPTPDPTSSPTDKPSLVPTSSPTDKPTPAPSEFNVWGSPVDKMIKWNGFVEFGQTHVIKSILETRHAPGVISEREAELLFTPTEEAPDTQSPTSAPTNTIVHNWGLENHPDTTVNVIATNTTWPDGYPQDTANLVDGTGSEYYIPNSVPDADINFDLGAQRVVQGAYLKSWWCSRIPSIQVGIRPDDGFQTDSTSEGLDSDYDPFDDKSGAWTWYSVPSISPYDAERTITIPKIPSRYVTFRFTGAYCTPEYWTKWGIRGVKISGLDDGLSNELDESHSSITEDDDMVFDHRLPYYPNSNAMVRIVGYSAGGKLLGSVDARSPENIRPILEQTLTTTPLPPYSSDAWSVTIPWNWMKEETKLMVGTFDPNNSTNLFVYSLILRGLHAFSEHTLVRTKVVVFGTDEDVKNLDTYSYDASPVAKGMFNSMPVASLHWVDSEVWHLPYLVTPTSNGPRLVHTEAERRQVLTTAGDDSGTQPGWNILKDQLAIKHNLANTGRGMAHTDPDRRGGSSPYSSGTSIFMAWSLSQELNPGEWVWEKMDRWSHLAAAWTGWCGMSPGDECGSLLIHELGHSQTMYHFTTEAAERWGIADEYPDGGVNLAHHPWGYDTTSRRFRTWYDHVNNDGKRDPMNGGEPRNDETCYSQYTAYHSQKSLNWGMRSPILLSREVSDIADGDGAYIFNTAIHQYEKVLDLNIGSAVHLSAMPPLEVGVPVVTFVGTLGADMGACQTYPALRAARGNTFVLPNPFDNNLSSSYFNDAAYFVKVNYEDSSDEVGLIGAQDLASSSNIGYYSFTIAMSKRPTSVSLYKYESDRWPDLSQMSSYKLLHTRYIDLPENAMDGVKKPWSVGRGWLGGSPEITIKSLCRTFANCLVDAEMLAWRGGDGSEIMYTSNVPNTVSGNASLFQVSAARVEDDTKHQIKIMASRYVEEGGELYPLIDSSLLLLSPPPDATHGILVYAPYELNLNLLSGTYILDENSIEISGSKDKSVLMSLVIDFTIKLLEVTDTVSLNPSEIYESDEFFPLSVYSGASSAYFLAENPNIGPVKREWWGGDRETLLVPLYSSCLGGGAETTVIASVKAQQTSCGSSWQMNAGRSAKTNCGHALRLVLDDETKNSWLFDDNLQGCAFSSHPIEPVVINAYRWHDPLPNAFIGSLVLEFNVPSTRPQFKYLFANDLRLWTEHDKKAKEWGGNLASIHSMDENNMLFNLVKNASANTIFIGGTRSAQNFNVWEWTDGTPFDFTNWDTGEPNNYKGNNETYINMWSIRVKPGGVWNDHQNLKGMAIYKKMNMQI